MLVYKARYVYCDKHVLGEVLDFPGTIALGKSLKETRRRLASALRYTAETNLILGEELPACEGQLSNHCADIEEPIHLPLPIDADSKEERKG